MSRQLNVLTQSVSRLIRDDQHESTQVLERTPPYSRFEGDLTDEQSVSSSGTLRMGIKHPLHN